MSYQATDVVEALVREYLVRAGCTGALDVYNREKPKHANSITKREVLRKSLGLDKAAAYYKKQNPTADGLPSTLEVWVIHQMAKLSAAPEAPAGPTQLPAPRPAPAPMRTGYRAATEPDEVSVPMVVPGFPRRPASGSGAVPAVGSASASTAFPGAVPAWRQKGVDPLRKGSGRSRSKRSLAPKVPGRPTALPGASEQRQQHSSAAPPTASRSRRELARPPSVMMPRLALAPQASKLQAGSQPLQLPALPPVRGAAKRRPPSHTNTQHPPHAYPHSHATAAGPGPTCPGTPAAQHKHGHRHATAAVAAGPTAMPGYSTPHKTHPTTTSTSSAASVAATASYRTAFTNSHPTPPGAASSYSTPAAPTTTTTESDLHGPRWRETAASCPGQAGPGRPAPVRQGFGFGEGSTPRPVAPAPAPVVRRGSTPSYNGNGDSDEEPEIIHSAASRGSAGASVRASQASAMHHSASTSAVSLRSSAPGVGNAPGLPMARTGSGASGGSATTAPAGGAFTPPRAPAANRPQVAGLRPGAGPSRGLGFGGEMVMEDVGDISFGDEDDGGAPAAAATGGFATMRISGPATRKPGSAISPEVMRQMKQLLWGAQGQPPPSWKQGFFFNRHPGLQYGLLQRQGGPCGVLAAVQALILAALHSPTSGFSTSPRAPEQQSALASAITESLWQARMGPTAALVLPEGEAGGAAGRLGYDQLSRALAQHTATSKEAMLDLVRGSLSVWMSEDGWGVVLFVMSVALSRGVANVQADMDEPNNSLMGMHGYCTQELVNMIALGVAHSNVFDGNKQLDEETLLKGISRRCRVGLLTLFEWYKYVEVGPSLKNPTLPVWVICSESHFTVLFAQDSRALQNQLPFDLFYYDELANQESPIRLSIAKDPRGGWTARVGSSFGDRGKCEGQNIPPLECVIETRWPGVKVNWNGHDPIL